MGNELPPTTTDTASEKLSGGVVGLLAPFQELIERLILTLSERDSVSALGHLVALAAFNPVPDVVLKRHPLTASIPLSNSLPRPH